MREYFTDGILWAALGPEPNIPGIFSRWAKLLGIPHHEMARLNQSDTWARAIHDAIGNRRMLLVIDDAWTVEDALTMKTGGTRTAHIVTTRYPSIAAHIAVETATQIQELNAEDSMTLLRLLAPQVVDVEAKKAYDLIHAVGGLPWPSPSSEITCAYRHIAGSQGAYTLPSSGSVTPKSGYRSAHHADQPSSIPACPQMFHSRFNRSSPSPTNS